MKILKNNEGQSLVEFALILPILLLIIMGIIEFGIMINSYLTVRSASREAARAAVVGSTNQEVMSLVSSICPNLDSNNFILIITPSEGSRSSGDALTVDLKYNYYLTVPIISSIFNNSVELEAQTTMRVE